MLSVPEAAVLGGWPAAIMSVGVDDSNPMEATKDGSSSSVEVQTTKQNPAENDHPPPGQVSSMNGRTTLGRWFWSLDVVAFNQLCPEAFLIDRLCRQLICQTNSLSEGEEG